MSADHAPFQRGDRVIINYPESKGFHGKRGFIAHKPIFKVRPKDGKTPGWWVRVNIDLPPELKTYWVEINANHVRAEA